VKQKMNYKVDRMLFNMDKAQENKKTRQLDSRYKKQHKLWKNEIKQKRRRQENNHDAIEEKYLPAPIISQEEIDEAAHLEEIADLRQVIKEKFYCKMKVEYTKETPRILINTWDKKNSKTNRRGKRKKHFQFGMVIRYPKKGRKMKIYNLGTYETEKKRIVLLQVIIKHHDDGKTIEYWGLEKNYRVGLEVAKLVESEVEHYLTKINDLKQQKKIKTANEGKRVRDETVEHIYMDALQVPAWRYFIFTSSAILFECIHIFDIHHRTHGHQNHLSFDYNRNMQRLGYPTYWLLLVNKVVNDQVPTFLFLQSDSLPPIVFHNKKQCPFDCSNTSDIVEFGIYRVPGS